MKKIAFAGTFDPITNGHIWVIEEALCIADEVVVMIAKNSSKSPLFSEQERFDVIEKTLAEKGLSNRVKLISLKNEYTALAALRYGCEYQIRGLRSALDFDYEALIQTTNTQVLHGVKTIFVMPPPVLESVSSSYVKTLIGPPGWHWHIKEFVPHAVYDLWIKKFITGFFKEHSGLPELLENEFLDIVFNNYTDSRRFYHSLDHIAHCIQELQWVMSNFDLSMIQIQKLTRAIYAHDIIQFQPNKIISDEKQSAIWFKDLLKKYDLEDVETENMIEATGYLSGGKMAQTFEEKLLCSIDLAILSQQPKVYNWYSQAIRDEYKDIPQKAYYEGRISALKKLLQRPQLYLSEYYEEVENLARHNLLKEIKELEIKNQV